MAFLFIGGCERSGTSLVHRLLCAHPAIAGGPELLFTRQIAELYRRMAAPLDPTYAERLARYASPQGLAENFRRFFDGLFEAVRAAKPEARFLAEKTPSNVAAAATLLALFPDSRFVQVLRDPRDVLLSHRRVRQRFAARRLEPPDPRLFRLRGVCRRWNRAVAMHHHLLAEPALAARYRWLRYEELVRNPEPALTGLLAFLDLEPATSSTDATEPLLVDGLWHTEEMAGEVYADRAGAWRRELPLLAALLCTLLTARGRRALAGSR